MRKRKTIKLFRLIMLLFSYNIIAQQTIKTPNVQTPEIYNLGLYGIYPVDYSTGVPKIDIPLYTVESGTLKLPISASYHASGIKVSQDASNIGLGWVLNAGGAIYRDLKDVPDEETNLGFLYTGNTIPIYDNIFNDQTETGMDGISYPVSNSTGNNDLLKSYYGTLTLMGGESAWHKDRHPDIFSISTNIGLTGEFMLNNNLQFVSTEFDSQNLNVDLPNRKIIIKDKDGNSYVFGKSINNEEAVESMTDIIQGDYLDGGIPTRQISHIKTWYLTDIISANQRDTIHFQYKNTLGYGDYDIAESRQVSTQIPYKGNYGITKSQTNYRYSGIKTLEKIIFKDGYILFDLKYDRQDKFDQSNSEDLSIPRISGFTVYDNIGKVIRKLIFENNSYFNKSNGGIATVSTDRTKSLKLEGINFYNNNNQLDNNYRFTYETNKLMPAKGSTYSIDFWGYYNGKLNTSLLPDELVTRVYNTKTLSNEKRESDFDFMKTNVLTQITYPTGGSTKYEYEPNYYIREKEGQLTKVKRTKKVTLYAIVNNSNCTEADFFNGVSPKTVFDYNVTEELAGGVAKVLFYFSDFKYSGTPMTATAKIDSYIFSENSNNQTANNYKSVTQNLPIGGNSTIHIELNTNNVQGPSIYSPCKSPFIQAELTYDYYDTATSPSPSEIIPQQAGGLRVKQITNYDSGGQILTKKSYEYGSKKVGNNIGVGDILTNPFEVESYYKKINGIVENCDLYEEDVINISSNLMLELAQNKGNPVFYDKVTEFTEDNRNNGVYNSKKEYYYSKPGSNMQISNNYYKNYNTFMYPAWKRSELIKNIVYKKEGSEYTPIRQESYTYKKIIEDRIRSLNLFEQGIEMLGVICSQGKVVAYQVNNPNRFRYFNDYTSIGKKVLTEKYSTDYTYTANKKDSLVTTTKYEYNNPAHFQLTKENTILPGLNKQETTYQYAHEKGNQYLIDKNMIGIPLQTSVIQKQNDNDPGKTISKSEILYPTSQADANARTSGLALPVSVLGFDLQNPEDVAKAQTELTYDLYDNKGNILQYSVKGKPVTVIWGYNQTQPIAKIEGATYNQVSAYVSAIIAASDADNTQGTEQSEQALIGALDILRSNTALSAYQITTYTYNPLIGVTSITPPSGIREIYKYDSANRLESVKDVNGNLLKEYQYRYKN